MKILQVSVWILMLLFTLQPSMAQDTPTETVDMTPQPTATLGGVPLKFVTGQAFYQNRLPDNAGIDIRVLDNDLNLLGTAVTNEQGVYSVPAPIDAFYWLVALAPLHQQQTLPIQPGAEPPAPILLGGDLDQDGCVGRLDVQLLVGQLDLVGSVATDITGDGVTDVADLAIVTGNFDPTCGIPSIEATEEATAEVTMEVTIEVTEESTAEVTAEVTAEITPELTVEVTQEATAEATVEITQEVELTEEATVELTVEVMPEITQEVELTEEAAVEVTPEITPEVAPPEITVEVTMVESTPEITVEPTAIQTPEPTATDTPTATLTPESTEEVLPTATPLPTQTPTPSVTFTPSATVMVETTVEPETDP